MTRITDKNVPDYQGWLDKGAWTFEEACWLYFGCEPPTDPFIAREILPEAARPYSNPGHLSFFCVLRSELERYQVAGKIKNIGKTSKGGLLFKPQVIISWIDQATEGVSVPIKLNSLLFPQKSRTKKITASKKQHQTAFKKIQIETPGLPREEEEKKMRELLSQSGFNRAWYRELRKDLNKRAGRPARKSKK